MPCAWAHRMKIDAHEMATIPALRLSIRRDRETGLGLESAMARSSTVRGLLVARSLPGNAFELFEPYCLDKTLY